MSVWRYACVTCGSVSISKVRKGNHSRSASITHYYCDRCQTHNTAKLDRKTNREVKV